MCIWRNHLTLIHAFFFDELCDSHPWWTAENLPGCRVTGLCVQQEGISSYAGRRGVYCAGGKTLQFVRILADLQGGEARADYSGRI